MGYTHLLEYDGGELVSQFGDDARLYEFSAPLHHFNGASPWALSLEPLPVGMEYADMVEAGLSATEYLQAAGSAPDKITVEIRKPGGQQWDVDWVRYVVGHPDSAGEPLNVSIKLPSSTQIVAPHEVFDADEVTELFWAYYKTGDIPASYALRPVEGYTPGGAIFDLGSGEPQMIYAGGTQ